MSRSLIGSVALVTGASSGIGEAAARSLARRGCHLILAARRLERLETLASDLGSTSGVRTLPLHMDVTREDEIIGAIDKAMAEFGRIDIAINNAGVGYMDWLEELDPASQIDPEIRVNLLGPILVSRCVLPHMQAARQGHLIFVASLASYVATPTYSIYAASKFGLRGFTDALRREVSIWGIRVSSLVPGTVATGFAAESVRRRRTGMTMPGPLVLSASAVGDKLAWLADHPRRTVVMPPVARAAIALDTLFPGLIDFAARRWFVDRERGTRTQR